MSPSAETMAETPAGGPTAAEIAERAYHRYLERGGEPGSPEADWFAAEDDLRGDRIQRR